MRALEDNNVDDEDTSITHTIANYGDLTSADSVRVKITDDDHPYSLASDTAKEGENAELGITLGTAAPSGGLQFTVTPTFASGSGKAVRADVGEVPQTITVAQGETTATLAIPLLPDEEADDGETFTVTITPAAGITDWHPTTTDANTATVTIREAPLSALAAVDDQTYTQNHPIDDLVLPQATGGSGTLTYTLLPQTGTLDAALPGLRFTAGTRTLSGTPTTATTQAVTLTYKVNDANGATAEVTFTVTVNDELVFGALALSSVVNQTYTKNHPIDDLVLPQATGGSGTLTYTLLPQTGTLAEALPDLVFTASTRTLSGTPTAKTTGAVTLTYKVNDANGATAEVTFTVTVSDELALSAVGNQTYTKNHPISNLVLPQAMGGSGTLTYKLLPQTGTLAEALPDLLFHRKYTHPFRHADNRDHSGRHADLQGNRHQRSHCRYNFHGNSER